jgi:bifunctional non-homologous end joining protein LigD
MPFATYAKKQDYNDAPEPEEPLSMRPHELVLHRASDFAPSREVHVTNPERLVYIDEGISKEQVLVYYQDVAERLLREIAGRPLSILRVPLGVGHKTFFQKHHNSGLGPHVRTVDIANKNGTEPYLYIEDERGLLELVEMNALEFHPWGSRVGQPEEPDRLIFDLDPGDCIDFFQVVEGAHLIRRELRRLRLESFVRASGGNGLHVVVPILPGPSWAEVKDFCQAFAVVLSKREPNRYVATLSKARRRGRVFIDWLRNARGATSAASWSLRARSGAPAAVPLHWDELDELPSGAIFDMERARTLALQPERNVWQGFGDLKQRLPNFRR